MGEKKKGWKKIKNKSIPSPANGFGGACGSERSFSSAIDRFPL